MEIIEKNILDIKEGIIVHQVNKQGVMGKGLALSIKTKYPQVEIDYKSQVGNLEMGDIITTRIESLVIVSLIGQNTYGNTGIHTDYKALSKGLGLVNEIAQELNLKVYIPYKIGCGLGGGNWNTVKTLINYQIPSSIICKLGV
jgi:O-acetyl-ADP-ribose deacetylase (regulator of RNase III)